MEFSGRDVHLWRLAISVGWSIVVQFIVLCTYIIVMNIDIWNHNVLSVPFESLLSTNSFYIIPLSAMIFFQGVVFSRNYLKPPKAQFINKRFLLLFGLFTYQNLVALCMYVSLGFSVSYVYSSLSKETVGSFSAKCSGQDTNVIGDVCLNEVKIFLILAGIWTGLYCFIIDIVFTTKTLIFPPIQQHKFIRIKAAFLPCLKRCMISSLFPSMLFCIVYYLKGHIPRSYISLFTGLPLSQDLLDTVFMLLNKELMLYLWIFTTLYMFSVDVMTILFNIHLTERAYFRITVFLLSSNDNPLFLHDAIASEKIPIIQHLGVLDLALLSQFNSERRAELFTLSQPGGHPHFWNAIVKECFKVIDKFTLELDNCIDVSHTENVSKNGQPVTKILDSSVHTGQHSYNMRNLSMKPNVECINQSPSVTLQMSFERLIKVYQDWIKKKVDAFYKKPIIAYLFGEMSEPKIKYLLFQSQPVIWAVESLSHLICHSVQEDSFGVAQKDLPKIITSLLHLKNSLDKLQKQSIFIKKSNKLDLTDIQMKNALKFSVKQSIYRIAIAFKDYVHEIDLHPTEFVGQMMNFVEFKEV